MHPLYAYPISYDFFLFRIKLLYIKACHILNWTVLRWALLESYIFLAFIIRFRLKYLFKDILDITCADERFNRISKRLGTILTKVFNTKEIQVLNHNEAGKLDSS